MLINNFFIFLINIYQKFISPILGPRCRFHPTCSEYALQCFRRFSFIRAAYYVIVRISKCQPLHPGGVDLPKD